MTRDTKPAYMKIGMAVGERVKQARTAIMLTQKELARRLHVSQSYLSEVENGKGKANIDLLVGLAIYFPGLSPEWLLTGRGQMMISDPGSGISNDKYNLDIEAVRFAQNLFYDDLDKRQGRDAARLAANQHYHFNLMYRTYMSHYDALIAHGAPEEEARALSRAQCEQLSEEDE